MRAWQPALVVVNNEEVAPGLVALAVHRVVGVNFELAFRAGRRAHTRIGIVSGCKSSFGFIARGYGNHRQHDFSIAARMLRPDHRKTLDHETGSAYFAMADSALGYKTVHTRDHLLRGSSWRRVGDFRTSLRSGSGAEAEEREGESGEQSLETSHGSIVPKGSERGNLSKGAGLKFVLGEGCKQKARSQKPEARNWERFHS